MSRREYPSGKYYYIFYVAPGISVRKHFYIFYNICVFLPDFVYKLGYPRGNLPDPKHIYIFVLYSNNYNFIFCLYVCSLYIFIIFMYFYLIFFIFLYIRGEYLTRNIFYIFVLYSNNYNFIFCLYILYILYFYNIRIFYLYFIYFMFYFILLFYIVIINDILFIIYTWPC